MHVDIDVVLSILQDKATIPKDNTRDYDPHVTVVPLVSPDGRSIPEETKEKGLYPNLDPPMPTLSSNGNPIDVGYNLRCNTYIYTGQITGECFVDALDGLRHVSDPNIHIHLSYQQFPAEENQTIFFSWQPLPITSSTQKMCLTSTLRMVRPVSCCTYWGK